MWPAARNTLVSSPQSVARSPQSECGPHPAARNLSVARNPQPAICDPQPAARNLWPATRSPQSVTRNPQPAMQSVARSPQFSNPPFTNDVDFVDKDYAEICDHSLFTLHFR